MKIQMLALILAAMIFLTEGANVSRPLNEGGNVYHVNNYIGGVQSKVILSFMKILDNKLDQIMKNTGVSSTGNTTIACLKGESNERKAMNGEVDFGNILYYEIMLDDNRRLGRTEAYPAMSPK
jgi:hypothetical protein